MIGMTASLVIAGLSVYVLLRQENLTGSVKECAVVGG